MSHVAEQILETFDSLPREEQHEILAELLRRSGELPENFLTDDRLSSLADDLFQTLDAEESDAGESNAEDTERDRPKSGPLDSSCAKSDNKCV